MLNSWYDVETSLPSSLYKANGFCVLQVLKGYRDGQNGTLPNAHLLGVFHRVCKLLTYRIKPVFVFDGGVPSLKQQTLVRARLVSDSELIHELIQNQIIFA